MNIEFANRGDRIESQLSNGSFLAMDLVTAESCAFGNELLFRGKWRLWKCPCCDKRLTECKQQEKWKGHTCP